ncbi:MULTISPECIES: serine/threonine-protein kinase [unclassified Herbaspirillum]|uniref:serine/threonine-protein kinase n=1 Tax=unclassified Herbaspirillum TaxID=2624150 RepID=UPI000E2F531E|nr:MULTISPECIES: serine/threonine-protein kinase [unclassified Herbaspirillum]RFB72950.1 serine/threonine protein kinase [Herbaspirillum sp. 3R-3a1]TFI11239.1 serine/threonine protein kinase [Herbaspirillum sp. 3R11]TFI17148.1 serine/threonine protein kinase [Herbaspirillum sp. 3R-11]TFI28897.1 serine/threonine protein kinase [Herbaspirillum sp. 3C11]
MIPTGAIIADRYRILNHVGRGGMQEVYRAHDTRLDMDVALKTPQAGQATKRFKASAFIAAKVNHHNVAKTLDSFDDNGEQYLVEEFVDGETLKDKLDRFGFFDPHLGAKALHYLLKGVEASHRAGVIHRDLKPSNVMVNRGVNLSQLKVTDFGVATLTQELLDEALKAGDITNSTSGTIKGALPFMAPEMMFRKAGENPGATVDVWSVGAMMFQLLTGELPFGEFLHAVANVKTGQRQPWPKFMTSNAQFAPLALELQSIVESCLINDPAARPTISELIARCEKLCYLTVDRFEGPVTKHILNGYAGFITVNRSDIFFSMESAYGIERPEIGRRVCYSSFPGDPSPRAHPVVVLKN